MADVPHFHFPFQVEGAKIAEVEQDSFEDVRNCAHAILLTPVGHRDELPAFGRTSPVFTSPPDVERLRRAVGDWEPRAEASIKRNETAFEAALRIVRARMEIGTGEQNG